MAEQNNGGVSGTIGERKNKSSDKKPIISYVFSGIVVLLLIYAVISIITQQAQISEEEQKLQEIRDEITEAQQVNDEYARLLSSEDEKAYMERIAIERMGYGYPNEKRFYAMSGN